MIKLIINFQKVAKKVNTISIIKSGIFCFALFLMVGIIGNVSNVFGEIPLEIPSWVKNVAEFWCHDKIDDGSFVEAIQYLIDNGIIVVPATQESFGATQEIPQWVKNNACWWSDGSITDLDFALGLEYLVKQGIIRV